MDDLAHVLLLPRTRRALQGPFHHSLPFLSFFLMHCFLLSILFYKIVVWFSLYNLFLFRYLNFCLGFVVSNKSSPRRHIPPQYQR